MSGSKAFLITGVEINKMLVWLVFVIKVDRKECMGVVSVTKL